MVYEDFTGSLPLLEKAHSFAKQAQDPELLAEVDHLYAVAHYIKGNYQQSLHYYQEAAENFRKADSEMGRAKCLVGQGLIQQGIDRHDEAIRLFEKAIKAYEASGNYVHANPAFLNIAISEIEIGNYNEAQQHLLKALDLAQKAGRVGVTHLSINKLGQLAYLEGDYQKSVKHYKEVLRHEEPPNGWERSFAYAGLAEVYLAQDKKDLAMEMGRKSMAYASRSGSIWDLERNTDILYRVYKSSGKLPEALEYLELNRKYRDSLYDEQKLREINLLQLENTEAENLRLELEKERAEKSLFLNRSLLILFGGLALLLLGLMLVYRKILGQKNSFADELREKSETIIEQNQLIRQRNQELDKLNQTKNRLFSILSHDLRSPIGSIEQVLSMIKEGGFSEEEKENLINEMLIQVSGTSMMLYNLLHWANSQMDGDQTELVSIDLPEVVEKVLAAHHLAVKNKNIHLEHRTPPGSTLIEGDKGQISVVIHNLISNAIKYTREGGGITISYKETDEHILFKILDGGEGIAPEKIEEIMTFSTRLSSEVGTKMEMGTGLGLLLVKKFLEVNHADMEINSYPGEGSEFIISFVKSRKANI